MAELLSKPSTFTVTKLGVLLGMQALLFNINTMKHISIINDKHHIIIPLMWEMFVLNIFFA